MDIKEFNHAVSLGLGRAVLNVDKHLPSPYADIILEACLHSRARDPQVEGSRAEYMLNIVRRTGNPSFYTDKVVEALSEDAGERDALQRFQMARLLAQEGDRRARQAMESAFDRQLGSPMEDVFAEEFITLDGIQGLLFVLGRIGGRLSVERERWADDYLLSTAEDSWGKEPVWSALTERAGTDENVSAYLEAVSANRLLRHEYQRPDPSSLRYEQIRAMIASGRPEGVLADWGESADPGELEQAACDLMHEPDPTKLRFYLHIFRKRTFPFGPDHLLKLSGMPDVPIARHALRALKNLQDDKVRSLALVSWRQGLHTAAMPLASWSTTSVMVITNL